MNKHSFNVLEFDKLKELILANIVVGVFTLMTPISILGTCGNPMMDCNVHTKPMVILLSSIFIIANVVYLVLNRDKLGKK